MLVTPRILSGFKDRLPNEALIKMQLIESLSSVFLSYGLMPIETPHLEYSEVLLGLSSDEIEKELYRFKDHGGRDVALRFDQTVPLARFITQHRNELQLPFKRFAIGNVFRGERAQKGRYREFTQCDFDIVGSESFSSDAEIIEIIFSTMHALNLEEFTIWINHRDILNGIFEYLGIAEVNSALRIIDKLDKIGLEGVKSELGSELDIDETKIERLLELVNIKQISTHEEFFKQIEHLKGYNEKLRHGIETLEKVFSLLSHLDIEISLCRINFSIARGLGYYTGIVYETTLDRIKSIGSVCSGGRYDNLTNRFSKERLSGVGASIGIDRLIAALLELDSLKMQGTFARILICVTKEAYLGFAHKLARAFRLSEIPVEVYPAASKIQKSLSYANHKGHEFAAIIGENEFNAKSLTLKNMTSGHQIENISFLTALSIVKEN
ncbi:histidine--tRNA ligase [Helicobacter sp. 11S02629-2]|uniref:histidine--tRNA ligase n=1 Tax=Helicobacter sp. 11S02629-2 TaxID=1476195 RepID=UPI000BA5D32F|nr:histidine--tRNA ligase [Helicobacter sp. 11S02629-2]PAF44126.1 histidine--tRNA ligase [Helicobacter sp. 11S02629-2]